MEKTTLIFDTSVLNALADEPDPQTIVSGLGIGYRVRLTETNVSEIAATRDRVRRDRLVRLCQHLVHAGECLRPYNWIIEELTKSHFQGPDQFHWKRLEIRGQEIEEEIVRPEFFGADELADEVRSDFRAHGRSFDTIYRDARTRFPLNGGDLPSLTEFIEALKIGGPFWDTARSLYRRGCGGEIDEPGIRAFADQCPPFNALMLSLFVAQFDRGVRDLRTPSAYKAGRLDLFMAVYLPYCDRFVTHDPGQCNALGAVAEEAKLVTEVWTYDQFRRVILLAA